MADRGEYFGNLALKNFQEFSDPEYFHWFPLAPGWYFVLALVAAYLAWLGHRTFRRYQQNAYRREAMRLLDSIIADHDLGQLDAREYLQRLRQLLKSTALKVYPRTDVAGLTGSAWLGFLNDSADNPLFDVLAGDLLDSSVYRKDYQPDRALLESFSSAVAIWLSLHRNPLESTAARSAGIEVVEAAANESKGALAQ